ncbi:MAG: hypothetical protein SVU32_04235 [Candidatus Nanohaloarchaea archaeon]|nr:hypothetical protein [Candidatus Nanohaloarchaea archaeon]
MSEIRECSTCGKRTDFWTLLTGYTSRGSERDRKWQTVLCAECSRGTAVEEAEQTAEQHVTREQ